MNDKIYKVNDMFVKHIAEYTNGVLTTCGFYDKHELEEINKNVFGITYNSLACTELPITWPDIYWVDDRQECHKIIKIDFSRINIGKAYIMDDGYLSEEVTG